MSFSTDPVLPIPEMAENLAHYALDRERVLFALSRVPKTDSIDPVRVEYEIHILQILSVGWSISYYMEAHSDKTALVENFWNLLFEFSQNISSVTSLSIGKEINYFQVLKERMDTYLMALSGLSGPTDPASVIGPAFAQICETRGNVHVIMAGTRIFSLAVEGVKAYLDSVLHAAAHDGVRGNA
jgi:hypothetical protein